MQLWRGGDQGKVNGYIDERGLCADSLVRNLVEEGLPLGGLWYSDYLDAR